MTTTATIGRTLLAWAGLDFDTAEMDLELREALARVAPEGGELRQLAPTASVRDARDAARSDATLLRVQRADALGADLEDVTPRERAADQLTYALDHYERARVALLDAHEALRRAQRLLS